MHFIEEGLQLVDLLLTGPCIRQNVCTSLRSSSSFRHVTGSVTCIRQNVCTSLRTMGRYWCRKNPTCLHTSKRMHFIEDGHTGVQASPKPRLHTSKRMHFIEEFRALPHSSAKSTCIRQNVCTSLRRSPDRMVAIGLRCLHTSKRMHFIEECCRIHVSFSCGSCIRQNVCTSLRSYRNCQGDTWATHLHTSKRMHFIEETSSSTSS